LSSSKYLTCFPCHHSNKKLRKPNGNSESSNLTKTAITQRKTAQAKRHFKVNQAPSTTNFPCHRSNKNCESATANSKSTTRKKQSKPNGELHKPGEAHGQVVKFTTF
jgi:hypothetical protein